MLVRVRARRAADGRGVDLMRMAGAEVAPILLFMGGLTSP